MTETDSDRNHFYEELVTPLSKKSPSTKSNPIVLRRAMSIGSIAAETDDEFLFDCFVRHPAFEACNNFQAPGMVLAGRTGSGKTAILRYLQHTTESAVEIDPADMAMSYVSNSDVLQFLHQIGADLDLLFQVLWKHILCIEFIRLGAKIRDETASKSFFQKIFEQFKGDERNARPIKYLREWEGKFWITMDQNIREITERYERKLAAELGGELAKFKAHGQYEKQLSTDKKSELVSRVRKIINADQLAELNGVISILQEEATHDRMIKCFILIDKLDERWVDDTIRFRLVRALIESLRAFRRITNLKIIVGMRSDVLERVVRETSDLGFQREKYDDYFIRLKWTREELKQLVQKRIKFLFQRKYTTENVNFEDLFRTNVGTVDPFDYLVDRTLMRPRDLITFVNLCIAHSEGKFDITATAIREAEKEYSVVRRQALEQEWQSTFPTLPLLLDALAKQRKNAPLTDVFSRDATETLALKICGTEKKPYDTIYDCASRVMDDGDWLGFAKEVVSALYRIGAIGIKLQAQERVIYSHIDQPIVPTSVLGEDSRINIHPMLFLALNIAH